MVAPTPTPSSRLVRAAAAEQEELRRHRVKLLDARESLRAELDRIETSLQDVEEREALLTRLTGLAAAEAPAPAPPSDAARAQLRGPAIRRTALAVLQAHPARPEALHYRQWYELVLEAGYEIAGKDPVAVFLTQISRSPIVRKGTQSGVYELDRGAPRRLRRELEELHAELRQLAAPPAPGADVAALRARRAELTNAVGQAEKALEEAEASLAQSAGELTAA